MDGYEPSWAGTQLHSFGDVNHAKITRKLHTWYLNGVILPNFYGSKTWLISRFWLLAFLCKVECGHYIHIFFYYCHLNVCIYLYIYISMYSPTFWSTYNVFSQTSQGSSTSLVPRLSLSACHNSCV